MGRFWQLLFWVQASHVFAGVSLDYVTVLLPHHIQGVGRPWLVVTASTSGGGCVNWTLHDKDIIITPLPAPECGSGGSRAAEISSVAFPGNSPRSRERIAAWVNVTEITTGEMHDFEVFVDAIFRLDMLLNTHVVGVEAYEILDLQAFDDKNNVFSTLVGLPFDWTIDLHNILKPATFNETSSKVAQYYQNNEASGTDRFPVKGVSPGRAHVNASLRDPYHPIQTQEIILVKEKLQIVPTVAYIAPQTDITYNLEIKRRENKMSEKWVNKKMPSEQYKWYLNNLTVGSIDRDLGSATGLELGFSWVTVNDSTLPDHFQSARLFVVEPVRASVKIGHGPCTGGKTYVTVNQTVDVTLELFDRDNHSLIITKNVEFHIAQSGTGRVDMEDTRARAKGLDLEWRSLGPESASHLKLRALEEGELTIYVRLGRIVNSRTGVEWPHGEIMASTPLVVSSPVAILSGGVILPVPLGSAASMLRVVAVGGSGLYEWSSENQAIATTLSGVITAQKAGSTAVWAIDQCNPDNKASVSVDVSFPAVPEFLPSPSEVQVASLLNLVVGVVDIEGRRFSNCSSLVLEISTSDVTKISQTHAPSDCVSKCPNNESWGCWTLTVRAQAPGFVEARASLPSQKKVALKPLASFPQIQSPQHIVLVVGSNMTFEWSFGPLPWPAEGFKALLPKMKHSPEGTADMSTRVGEALHQHVEGVTTLNSVLLYRDLWDVVRTENKSELKPFSDGDYVGNVSFVTVARTAPNQFTVTCLDSTYKNPNPSSEAIALELRVGNSPSSQNKWPVVAKLKVKLTCYPRLRLEPPHTFLGLKTNKQLEIYARDKFDSEFARLKPSHPLLKLIHWRVNSDDVVDITQTGLVTGLKLGQTPVTATLNLAELEHMSAEEVTRIGLQEVALITVVFEDFIIKAPTKHILQLHQTVVYLEGRNGEVPIDSAFEHIQVQWTVDSTVAELLPVLHSGVSSSDNRPVEGYSIGLRGRRPGNFVITAKIHIDRPEAERDLNRTFEMTVLEPLALISPSFLLLPHGASATIVTTLDNSGIALSYQAVDLCKTPVITVDNRGVVQARGPHSHVEDETVGADEFGMVVVQTPGADGFTVASKHTHVSQTKDLVSVLIEVRAPSHLSLRVSLGRSGPLCVGSNRTVELVLRDRLGRIFHSLDGWDASDLKIEVNHPEVAVISEAEADRKPRDAIAVLNISAIGANGLSSAVAKLWLENQPYIAPLYVRIETAANPSCVPPATLRVRLYFADLAAVTEHSARKEWETKAAREIAIALDVTLDRVVVVAVNSPGRFLEVDLAPARILLHEDQWHLVDPEIGRTPAQLLVELEKQAQDPTSALRKAAIGQQLSGRVEQVEAGAVGWVAAVDGNATPSEVCLVPPPANYDLATSFWVILLVALLVGLVWWVLSVGGASRPQENNRIDPRQDFRVRDAALPAY